MNPALARLALIPLTCIALAAGAASLTGSGKPATETRNVTGFNSIGLAVPGKVELTQGDQESVVVTADDNVLPEVETVVENGALKIRFANRDLNVNRATISIKVTARTLDHLAIGGSGDIHSGPLKANKLSLSVGGSGNVSIDSLAASELSASIGGSGNIAVKGGNIDSLHASIAGSGDLAAARLAAKRVSLSVAGSGDAAVWASETLSVHMAGSGSVRYYGDAKVSRSIVGSGDVKRLGASPS